MHGASQPGQKQSECQVTAPVFRELWDKLIRATPGISHRFRVNKQERFATPYNVIRILKFTSIKGFFAPKLKILSSFTDPQVVPYQYSKFLSSVKQCRSPLTSIVWPETMRHSFCPFPVFISNKYFSILRKQLPKQYNFPLFIRMKLLPWLQLIIFIDVSTENWA